MNGGDMQTFASIFSFLAVLVFMHSAPAAQGESGCAPVQYVTSADTEYVTPDILRRSYATARTRMGVSEADAVIVLRYPFNAEQSAAIGTELFNRWGLYIDTTNLAFTVRLGPRRTQLLLASGTQELVRLDYMLHDETDAVLAFASVPAPDGGMTCIAHTELQKFFWGTVITKMLVLTYPEGLPVAME